MFDLNDLMQMQFKQFYIAMTNRCNLKCRMCTTTTHPHELEEELSLAQWEKVIENISRFKVESIGFGGGEPLTREKDLAFLVKKSASKGIIVNIITNGTLLKSDFLDEVMEYKEKIIFLFSLDGLEKENDFIRGEKVFSRVMEAARILQKYSWTFYITSVLMPENFFGYVGFLRFIMENFPDTYLDIQPIIPHNEIYYKRKKFELNEDQLKALKDILLFLHSVEDKIKLCRPLKMVDRYWEYFTNNLCSQNQCKMGTASFNINLRGNIWICGKELDFPLDKYMLEDVLSKSEYELEMQRVKSCNSPCLAGLVI